METKILTKKSLISRELITIILTLSTYFIVFSILEGCTSNGQELSESVAIAGFVAVIVALIRAIVYFGNPTPGVAAMVIATSIIVFTPNISSLGRSMTIFLVIAFILATSVVLYCAAFLVCKKGNLSRKFVISTLVVESLILLAGVFSIYLFI
jgi:hypothetical protein